MKIKKILFCLTVSLCLTASPSYGFDDFSYDNSLNSFATGEEFEVAAPPVVIAIGILVKAGLNVGSRVVARHFSARSAQTAAMNISRNSMKIVGRARKCFSVAGANGQRILLAADMVTVLYAGDHDTYERKINRLCN